MWYLSYFSSSQLLSHVPVASEHVSKPQYQDCFVSCPHYLSTSSSRKVEMSGRISATCYSHHGQILAIAGGQGKGQRVAAATYLKNYLRSHWAESKNMSVEDRLDFRNQLVEVLLRIDSLVLKLLAEAVCSVISSSLAWNHLVRD